MRSEQGDIGTDSLSVERGSDPGSIYSPPPRFPNFDKLIRGIRERPGYVAVFVVSIVSLALVLIDRWIFLRYGPTTLFQALGDEAEGWIAAAATVGLWATARHVRELAAAIRAGTLIETSNVDALAQAFDYVIGLAQKWPWSNLGQPPWAGLNPYHWLQIPAKFREQLNELRSRIEVHEKLYAEYSDFMSTAGTKNFGSSVRAALSKYVSSDGSAIEGKKIGVSPNARIEVQWIAAAVVPCVLLNRLNPEKAWAQLTTQGPDLAYWAIQIVLALQKNDQQSLKELFDAIVNSPDASTAVPMVESLNRSFEGVLSQATIVCDTLAARLGLTQAIKT